jgi:hypothetical protein
MQRNTVHPERKAGGQRNEKHTAGENPENRF